MPAKIGLWCGFCIVVYWKKKDGVGMNITVTARGKPRKNPDLAWEDAQRMEGEQEKFVKAQGARPSTVQTGICPPDYLY